MRHDGGSGAVVDPALSKSDRKRGLKGMEKDRRKALAAALLAA
eukprot:gene44265-56284_t